MYAVVSSTILNLGTFRHNLCTVISRPGHMRTRVSPRSPPHWEIAMLRSPILWKLNLFGWKIKVWLILECTRLNDHLTDSMPHLTDWMKVLHYTWKKIVLFQFVVHTHWPFSTSRRLIARQCSAINAPPVEMNWSWGFMKSFRSIQFNQTQMFF